MQSRWWLCSLLLAGLQAFAANPLKPTQEGLVYGKAGHVPLTMDYYSAAGVGAHPIAMLIAGAGEAQGPEFLVPAGYDVFVLHDLLGAPVESVKRAIRYVRFHAREWHADSRKIALIGVTDAAYLSMTVGLANASGVMGSDDAVDRESARVQAAVAIIGLRDLKGASLDPLLQEKAQEASLAQSAGSNYVDPSAAAFLLIEREASGPTADLQQALRKVGVHCDLLRTPDWHLDLVEWLNKTLAHEGL